MSDFGLTSDLIEMVKQEERWVNHPYLDPVGYPTIGFGHRIPEMGNQELSYEQGYQLLLEDLRHYRDKALELSPGLAREPERRLAAITDFCFNCGVDAYEHSRLRTAVNAQNWGHAAEEMKKWVWATDQETKKRVKLPGLISRRGITAGWLA